MEHTYRDLVFRFSPLKDLPKLKQLLGQHSKELFGKELTELRKDVLANYIIKYFIKQHHRKKVDFEKQKNGWLSQVFQAEDYQQPSSSVSTPKPARKRPFGDPTNK